MLNYLRIKQYVLWCFDFYSILFGVQTPCNFNDPYRLSSSLHLVLYNLVIHYLFPFFSRLIQLLVHSRKMRGKKHKNEFYFQQRGEGSHFYAGYGILNSRQHKHAVNLMCLAGSLIFLFHRLYSSLGDKCICTNYLQIGCKNSNNTC